VAKLKMNSINQIDPNTLVSPPKGHPEYTPRNDLADDHPAQLGLNKSVAQGWDPTSTLHGVVYPDGMVYLRSGNKRRKAAIAAGLKEVPVFVTEHDPKAKRLPVLDAFAANIRVETPLGSEMEGFALARQQGATVAEIALFSGKTEKEVTDVLFAAAKFAEIGKKPKKDESDSARQVREMENEKMRKELMAELNLPGERAFKVRALLASDGASEEDRAKFVLSALRAKRKDPSAPKPNRVANKKSLAFTKDQLVTLSDQIVAIGKKEDIQLGSGEVLLMTSVVSLILGDIDMEAFEATVKEFAQGGESA